jgi:hypothetical protein
MRRFEFNGYGEYALTKREEVAITKAFAQVARFDLRADQRKLLEQFAHLWFAGKQMNFDPGKLGHAFLELCESEKVKIVYMRRVKDGPTVECEFKDRLDYYERRDARSRKEWGGMYSGWGSCWIDPKTRKSVTQEQRREFREGVLNAWLTETGYRRDQLSPWINVANEELREQVAALQELVASLQADSPKPVAKLFRSHDEVDSETVH